MLYRNETHTVKRGFPRHIAVVAVALFLFLSVFAFPPLQGAAGAGERKLTIAAASSLAFALKEVVREFEAETGHGAVISFGSTGKLARQIENGAPFDLFFAAHESYIKQLVAKGLITPDTVSPYGQGRIVLATNRREGGEVHTLEGLLAPDVRRVAIANPLHAPYGKAAKEALMHLGLWKAIKPKLVYGENIRQTLQFIKAGDAPVGIIALSVADTKDIAYTVIDGSFHTPLTLSTAVIKQSPLQEEALSFIRLITSPKGQRIMRRYGLQPGVQ